MGCASSKQEEAVQQQQQQQQRKRRTDKPSSPDSLSFNTAASDISPARLAQRTAKPNNDTNALLWAMGTTRRPSPRKPSPAVYRTAQAVPVSATAEQWSAASLIAMLAVEPLPPADTVDTTQLLVAGSTNPASTTSEHGYPAPRNSLQPLAAAP